MFELRMILTTRQDGVKVLRLGHGFRAAFGLIAAFILIGSFSTGELAVLPGILALLSVVAVFYDERWAFDREANQALRCFGLVFLHQKRTYSLANAEYLEYASFAQGSSPPGTAAMGEDRSVAESAGDSRAGSGTTDAAGGAGPFPRRHALQRQFETLSLVFDDGDRVDIEKQRGRSTGGLKEIAERLSEYCGIPLRSDER